MALSHPAWTADTTFSDKNTISAASAYMAAVVKAPAGATLAWARMP
jgi:hypothetical protein